MLDQSRLRFGDVSEYDIAIVEAVQTFSLESLFKFDSFEFLVSAFALINSAVDPVSPELLGQILGKSVPLFHEYARRNRGLRVHLAEALPSFASEALLEFAVGLIGLVGETVIVSLDGWRIRYDSGIGIAMPAIEIASGVSRTCVLGLLVLMYTQPDIDDLPGFFKRRDFADQLLTLYEGSAFLPPEELREMCLEFVIRELFSPGKMTPDFVARTFPRIFRAGLTEEVMSRCDLRAVAARVINAYLAKYETSHLRWFLQRMVENQAMELGASEESEVELLFSPVPLSK
jgi:hypothetical protein